MMARQWGNVSWPNGTVIEAWRVDFNYVRTVEAIRCSQGEAIVASVGTVIIPTYP